MSIALNSSCGKPNGQPVGRRSAAAFTRARQFFPDGTTRVTVERDPIPRYMARGEGAYLIDVDDRRFLDLNGNFTTLIHGHGFAPVIDAVERQLRSGTCFANPTEAEIALAELLCARVPRLERIRFVNTGTEAVMFAIKAARAFTGRCGIAKIEGAYHGAYDWAEVAQASSPESWGPETAPRSVPNYHGMPAGVLRDVTVLRPNDAEGAARRLASQAQDLAAVIIDPMPSRAGLIAPERAFIDAVQQTAREHGILVICDEVLNFRQGYEGASARYGLEPDLITFGKIIGGGFPIGAVGGREEIMAVFGADGRAPLLAQGGTFSANPVSMRAGLAAMEALDRNAFGRLERLGDDLRRRLEVVIERHGAPFCVTGAASLFRIHPRRIPPREFREAYLGAAETLLMKELTRFFGHNGVVLPFGGAACLSTPMGEEEIALVVDIFEKFIVNNTGLFEGIEA